MDIKPLDIKGDARGLLVEAYKLPQDGQVFYVIANPGRTRGDHYHLHKTETFLVIYGSAEITVKDRQSGNVMSAKVNGGKPMSVKVIPNHTHRITASDEGAIFLVWADEQFDENDPDTYPEEI